MVIRQSEPYVNSLVKWQGVIISPSDRFVVHLHTFVFNLSVLYNRKDIYIKLNNKRRLYLLYYKPTDV